MLSARHGQENVVGLRQGLAKNMGPVGKTPLKVPLNDENAASAIGGKTGLGGKSTLKAGGTGKAGGVSTRKPQATPMVPGTSRAPLGNKTTNARARASRPGSGGKGAAELQQTVSKGFTATRRSATSQRRQAATKRRSLNKVLVRADALGEDNDAVPEPESGPPPPADLPYESDVFPDGALSLAGLRPENLLRGYYDHFHDPVDSNGVRVRDKQLKKRIRQAALLADEEIKKAAESIDWSVADVPETRRTRRVASDASSCSAGNKMIAKPPSGRAPPAGKPVQRPLSVARPRSVASRPATAQGARSGRVAIAVGAAAAGPAAKTVAPAPTHDRSPGLTLQDDAVEEAVAGPLPGLDLEVDDASFALHLDD